MNKQITHPLCQDAELYYYDYLQDGKDQVPEAILTHIGNCPNCQNEIQWLKGTVEKSDKDVPESTQANLLAAQMQLHGTLIDQPVKCSTIKSFLPILAMPEMAVRVATPVTAHIQACSECAYDLETLQRQNLSFEQLSVLSSILSQKQSEDAGFTEDTVTEAFFQEKKDSSNAIRRIIDRPDSGIVTIFRTNEPSDTSEDPAYHVKVIHNAPAEKNVSPADPIRTPKTQVPAVATRRWWFKPVAAAAAVLIIATLLFQSSSVTATDIGQIYETLKNVKSIALTQYDVDIADPVQVTYVSGSLGIKLYETGGVLTLYDLNDKIQKTKTGPTSDVQQNDMNREMIQMIAGTMDVPWGLLPFKKISDLPDGAVWEKVQPKKIDLSTEQTEIFALLWSDKADRGDNVYYQWRCHINAATKRPIKVEWRQKKQLDQEYELITYTEISYPTENQINEIIEQAGL